MEDYDEIVRINPKDSGALKNRELMYGKIRDYDRGDTEVQDNFALPWEYRGHTLSLSAPFRQTRRFLSGS
jgi:hypothetical protein